MHLKLMSTTASSTKEEGRLQAIWQSVDIPPRLAAATLDNYWPENYDQEKALRVCRSFARQGLDNLVDGRGLFFQGPVGTGKSHLSVATLRAVVENNPGHFGRPPSRAPFYDEPVFEGHYCSLVSVVELLDRLRESFKEDKMREALRDDRIWASTRELLRRCRGDAIVIMDDIGAQKPTDWVEEQLYSLIDLRYRMQRSTFFTTNCSLQQLGDQIGYRCVSRIMEMCEGIKVEGEDWRVKHKSLSLSH